MKKILFFAIFFIIFFQCLHAAYRENMAAGNAAYKKGDLEQALIFYEAALEEQPSDQLFAFMDKLKKKIEDKKRHAAAVTAGKPDKTPLFVIDIALAGLAVASYMDYSASCTAYEALYTDIDNTSESNYRILVNERAQVDSKGTYMAVVAAVAGASVLYTILDLFVINGGNSGAVSADIRPWSEYAGVLTTWKF